MKIFTNTVFVCILIAFFALTSSCQKQNNSLAGQLSLSYTIPLEGNCWIVNAENDAKVIDEGGLKNWTDSNLEARIYFKTENVGTLNVALLAKTVSGSSEISSDVGQRGKNIAVSNYLNLIQLVQGPLVLKNRVTSFWIFGD